MIRPKGMNDCSCSPWQRLKEQIQALYERVTQVEQVNIDQTGDIQDLDFRVTALEDAPVVAPEWGNITGDLEDQTDLKDALDDKADASSLAPVALSGDYDDLSNKPTIPDAQVQADWNEADTTAVDYIKNKPIIPSQIVVDSSMIQDSTNPVQSKVIQTALDGKADTTDLPDASELVPATTGASQGDVLTVGAGGPEWTTPAGPAGGSEKSIIVEGIGSSGFVYNGTTYANLLSLALAVKDGNKIPGIVIVDTTFRTLTALPPLVLSGTRSGSIQAPCITKGGIVNKGVSVTYMTQDGELTFFNISYNEGGWLTARIYVGGSNPSGTKSKGDLWINENTKALSYYDGTTWQTLFTPSS